MTRAELIDALTRKFRQLQLGDVELSVKLILDAISKRLLGGGRAEIRGFGSFHLNYKPARTGRNPRTGVSVDVPAKWTPHFKPGKELRERVDFPQK